MGFMSFVLEGGRDVIWGSFLGSLANILMVKIVSTLSICMEGTVWCHMVLVS